MTICGLCGKVIADNIPPDFRTEKECMCGPQDYREAILEEMFTRCAAGAFLSALKEHLLG